MEKDKYDIKEDLAMRIFRTIYYRQIEDMRYIKFSNKDSKTCQKLAYITFNHMDAWEILLVSS